MKANVFWTLVTLTALWTVMLAAIGAGCQAAVTPPAPPAATPSPHPTPAAGATDAAAPTSSAAAPEPTASPSPSPTLTVRLRPTPTAMLADLVDDCMSACHIPDPNESFGEGAKPQPKSHQGYATCLECHTSLAKPALPATHPGRLDAACAGCHQFDPKP